MANDIYMCNIVCYQMPRAPKNMCINIVCVFDQKKIMKKMKEMKKQ